MPHDLPDLPYAQNALEPHISARTLSFHHGKHHAGYVTKLNAALEGSDLASAPLEKVIRSTSGGTFNNAAQVWNHTFYWNSMSPRGGGAPSGALADALHAAFGSLDAFKEQFSAAAAGQFGSGWAWLVKGADGVLSITTTANADTPMTAADVTLLLTCDVWEHAYYLDYQNARPAYIDAWWNLVNWDFAAEQLG